MHILCKMTTVKEDQIMQKNFEFASSLPRTVATATAEATLAWCDDEDGPSCYIKCGQSTIQGLIPGIDSSQNTSSNNEGRKNLFKNHTKGLKSLIWIFAPK